MNGTEDFFIVACDGLWDTVTPEDATECVFKQLRQNKGESFFDFLPAMKIYFAISAHSILEDRNYFSFLYDAL